MTKIIFLISKHMKKTELSEGPEFLEVFGLAIVESRNGNSNSNSNR